VKHSRKRMVHEESLAGGSVLVRFSSYAELRLPPMMISHPFVLAFLKSLSKYLFIFEELSLLV
jgi:hypothetical protein